MRFICLVWFCLAAKAFPTRRDFGSGIGTIVSDTLNWITGSQAAEVTGYGTSPGDYQLPEEGDSRGPCPGLNTLANHGYIPRDGNNITEEMLLDVLPRVFGLGHFAAKLFTVAAYGNKDFLLGSGVRNTSEILSDGTPYLNLNDLNLHGRIEHDASLTRLDAALGDNHNLNRPLLHKLKQASSDGLTLTRDDMVTYRVARFTDSRDNNKDANLDLSVKTTAWGESALALMIFGNSDHITLDAIDSFFGQERFPDGYQKSDPEIGAIALLAAIADLEVRASRMN